MSKAELTTPILVEVDNTLYKLLYISFSGDGSIYVFFPRKKGYLIAKEKNLPKNMVGEQTISLDKFPEKIFSPYISYHPKSKSIHINTRNAGAYKFDTKVVSLAEDEDILAFPLCQVLFPYFSYLDVYSSAKYRFPYVIKSKTLYPPSSLKIEKFIQPVGTDSDWEDLPLDKARRATSDPVGLVIFSSEKLKSHTCLIAVTELKVKTEILDGVTPGILVAMFNNQQSYIFELAPND